MNSSVEINSKFFTAFEKAISSKDRISKESSEKSVFKNLLSTMEFVASNLKSSNSQLTLKDQNSAAIANLFCEFSLSLDFKGDDKSLSPRAFGALYEHYCNRSDLAAFYSSGDVATYVTESAISSWILERLLENKSVGRTLSHIDIDNTQNLNHSKIINDLINKGDKKTLEALNSALVSITVLDPTCGCGSFYFAALDMLLALNLKVAEKMKKKELTSIEKRKLFDRLISKNLFGVDIDANAVEVIRFQIKMYRSAFSNTDVDSSVQIADNLHIGDALLGPPFVEKQKEPSKKMFDWTKAFPQIVGRKGFEVIIGNPPYLEFEEATTGDYSKTGMTTTSCRDLYALTMERSLQVISKNGRVGFIVPISAYSSPRFSDLRKLLAKDLDKIWIASFANRPAQLFKGAQKRLNIILGRKGSESPKYFTSEYIRWKSDERSRLFTDRVKFVENPLIGEDGDIFFKSGCKEDIEILKKLEKLRGQNLWAVHSKPSKNVLSAKDQVGKIYFTRAFGYFLYFLDFVVEYKQIKTGAKVLPSEFHCLEMIDPKYTKAAAAVLNSSLFYWFLSQTTDCRNVNFKEVLDFPLDFSKFDELTLKRLSNAGDKLLKKIRSTSFNTQKSGLQIQTFDYLSCVAEIKNCDEVVLAAYGISGKSAARVLSFDMTYRFSTEGKRRNGAAA